MKNKYFILFVDDEEIIIKYFVKIFENEFNIYTATNITRALEILQENHEEIAIIVTDQKMKGGSGVDLLNEAKEKYPNIIRIITTAYASLEDSIRAIKESSVFSYITKPWNIEDIRNTINQGLIEFNTKKKLIALAGSIAHEIRNPLNIINLIGSQINELAQGLDEKDNNPNHQITHQLKTSTESDSSNLSSAKSKLLHLTSQIGDSIENANNIINIILGDLSEKNINPEDFIYLEPSKILPDIIEKFGYKNNQEKEKAKLLTSQNKEEDFLLKAEPDRLTYIIFNLLKNALYYLKDYPNSIVSIGTETRDIEGVDYNVIFVNDTGPGIPPHIIPKLFGDFYTSGKKEGTGLGLSFCKRNMQLFGGDIICESEFCEGKSGWTKFSLLFPKLSAEEVAKAKLENNQKKILLVDDQETNLVITKSKLEKGLPNVFCDIARSGKEAIELAKQNKYRLILMDIQMPGFCGITTTKQIRELIPQLITNKSESQTELPIIALTSLDYKTFIDSSNKAQAKFSAYINKSSSNNILCRAVAKWMFDYKDNFSYLGTEEQYNSNLPNILKDKEVLLVDDQEINRKITKRSLERYGLKVSEGNNGEELIKHYQESLIDNTNYTVSQTKLSKFSIIITDINMPIISGDEATLKVREIEDSNFTKYQNRIPIIALSGDGENKDIAKYLQSQMTDYFIKGNDPNLLIKIIANYIKDDEARKESVCEDDMNNADIKNDIIKNNSDNNLYNQSSNTNSNTNNNTNNTNNTISANKNINTTLNSSTLFNKLNLPNLVIFNHSKIDFFEPQEKAEIINLYIADSNKSLNKIKEDNQQENNYLNTSFDVHALKGMTSNIGGEKLVAFICNIEISLKKNQAPENQNWIIELENLHQELVAEMKNLCTKKFI
jgi:CheY-like chemotaxis protein/HPt (histidine-containing phosphotransfer) domain-containing protein